ncbi:hypothetical protein BDV97DRAFT_364694 [Delphinella strobiligena]|nr:hypothetical protein BDV97DRAFT_364694 [Delphinella strobiligena]
MWPSPDVWCCIRRLGDWKQCLKHVRGVKNHEKFVVWASAENAEDLRSIGLSLSKLERENFYAVSGV